MDWSRASLHLINNPSTSPDIYEIQQKGRIAYLTDIKRPLIGRPELRISTPRVDGGRVIAAAKLKASYRGCDVLLGDPGNSKEKKNWQFAGSTDALHTKWEFEFEGRKFAWRRFRFSESNVPMLLEHGSMELIGSDSPDEVLAIYDNHDEDKPTSNSSSHRIGKLELLDDMDEGLEILALVTALGLSECMSMDNKSRNTALTTPANAGVFGVAGVGGPIATGA